ncbi:MAG: hypothetical protein LLG13_03715 [Bacteroidales bacterium]|nr:hypothetical protein [Bacteroidales bacterium]
MNNLELIQKLLLITTGFIALLFKIKSYFSIKTQKHDLKLDIEILDLLKKQNNPNTENIEKKVKKDIEKIYDQNLIHSSEFTGFIIGLTFFIGFGWWSISIFNNSQGFNAWIILTMFLSASGISMILMDSSRTIKNQPFFILGFYEKSNMRFGLLLSLLGGFMLLILILRLRSFSFCEFLSGFIFLYGLFLIIKNIRKVKI